MRIELSRIVRSPEGEGGGGTPAAAPSAPPAATPSPAGPAPAAPSPSGSDGAGGADFNQIEEVLRYDPFAEKPTDAKGKDGVKTTEPPVDGGGTPTEPTTPTAPVAPTPTVAPPENPLEKTVRELQAKIETLTAAQTPAEPTSPSEPKPAEVPPYAFNLPDALLTGLASEDPAERKHATGALLTGAAQAIHRTVMANVETMLNRMPELVQGMLVQHQQQQEIFQDFYGSYPELNKPELRPLVLNTAKQVLQETGAQSWSPEVSKAIGTRVKSIIAAVIPTGAPLPTASTVPSTPTPPPQFGRRVSPALPPNPDQIARDVAETLGLG